MKLFWLATIFMAGVEAQETTTVSPTGLDSIGARAKKSKAQRDKEREERQKNKGKNKVFFRHFKDSFICCAIVYRHKNKFSTNI